MTNRRADFQLHEMVEYYQTSWLYSPSFDVVDDEHSFDLDLYRWYSPGRFHIYPSNILHLTHEISHVLEIVQKGHHSKLLLPNFGYGVAKEHVYCIGEVMTELYAVAIQKRLREYTVPQLLSYAMPDEWYFNSFFTQMRGEYPKQLYEDVFYRVYEESSEDRLKADWDSACQYLAENSTSK